jgi:DNA-binding transcriptional ArsR family regulator
LEQLDLILHPVRLRIITALERDPLTTQQITTALGDVPASSIYRHLRLLLEGNMIRVARIRQVKGIEEKVYELAMENPLLAAGAFEGLGKQELSKYFSIFFGVALNNVNDYLEHSPDPQWTRDQLGFGEFTFYATREEFRHIWDTVWEMLLQAERNLPNEGRVKRKMTVAMYPGVVQPTDQE